MHPRPEKAPGVPKVLRSTQGDFGSLGPYTASVLAAILGCQLHEISALSGLQPPKNKLTKKEKNDLRVFFTAALEIAMLRDGRDRLTC